MIAYKGFNKDLVCTRGNGQYQYEVGKTYVEEKAKCVSTGFHCVEEPIEVLTWYSSEDSRYCMVEAAGDIHEDGDERIACTQMKIIKELTIQQIAALECIWLKNHPERLYSRHVHKNEGLAVYKVAIVRGKHPKAKGNKGDTLFLLQEEKSGKVIENIGIYEIDGTEYKENVWYNVLGKEIHEKRGTKKA